MKDHKSIRKMAGAKWSEIFESVLPEFSEALQKAPNHVSCPIHGGKDGFRFFEDWEKTGGGICNTCGSFPNGFKLLAWALDISSDEALTIVEDFLKNKTPVRSGDSRKTIETINSSKLIKREKRLFRIIVDGCSMDGKRRIETYLKSRGLSGKIPFGFYFNPGINYFDNNRNGKGKKLMENFPAIVAKIHREKDVCGVHLTYLAQNGDGKAQVPSPKKLVSRWDAGKLTGGAIRIGKMSSKKPLVVCEGIETGLAIHEATGWPVYVATSAVMLEKVKLPDAPPCFYIAADLDLNATGQNSACKLANLLVAEGKKIYLVTPEGPIPQGHKSVDWLDVLNQFGTDHVQTAFKNCPEFISGQQTIAGSTDIEALFAKHKLNEIEEISDAAEASKRLTGFVQDTKDLEAGALGFARSRLLCLLKRLNYPAPIQHLNQLYGAREEGTDGMCGRPLVFEEIEPWAEEVDGADLLNNLAVLCNRHVILPQGAADAIALWIVFSWSIDAFQIAPNLVFKSPEKRCGKTTALTLLKFICPRCLPASNCSPAALFRSVQESCPTLLIDEADQYTKHTDEINQIINSSHNRAHAFTVRVVGENHQPRTFSTWCPKIIALIGKLPSTLEDRSIVLEMKRKKSDEKVERLLAKNEDNFLPLKQRILRWVNDHLPNLRRVDPELPETLNDRAQDNWTPIFAIADLAGEEWPQRARKSSELLSRGLSKDEGPAMRLLKNLKEIFTKNNAVKLGTQEIVKALNQEHDWDEITDKRVASLLKRFGIAPTRWKDKNKIDVRGYTRKSLADAWERYI